MANVPFFPRNAQIFYLFCVLHQRDQMQIPKMFTFKQTSACKKKYSPFWPIEKKIFALFAQRAFSLTEPYSTIHKTIETNNAVFRFVGIEKFEHTATEML